MIRHTLFIASALFCAGICTHAAAQDTPQSALDRGDAAQAAALLEQMSSGSDEDAAIEGLAGQAQLAIQNDDLDKAASLLNSLNAKKSGLKKKDGWNVVILWLNAEFAQKKNDTAAHLANLKAALDAIEGGAQVGSAWAGTLEYLVAMAEQDNSAARDHAEYAIEALHGAKLLYEEGLAHLRLAELEWARQKQRRAFRSYDNALRAFRNSANRNARLRIAETQLAIAEKHLEVADARAASARLTLAQHDIEAAGSPEDLTARLDALQAKIPE